MAFAWKQAGVSYNKYLSIAAQAIRKSLKEQARVAAERRSGNELKVSRWENGKQQEAKYLGNSEQ
ncbi:hypothetical protein TWF569_004122 [Orbilia oligospora]|uniref:Uncharacterized protein n=5 Tax=Orbiliaceae TaxID=47021 RepID=G1XTS4_ARTOA|nr:hypothetical protein AOL_s00215g203 [Orbilia oligospora ATCC 24927]KAF3087004.1 hypothetical protein TWF706_011292 [Orbilia oligospora]EGX43467.1 hypothetical protein AOL_s00215g203 [Orbilia oligospora ATCC 24927]KAF3094896.1 hypothetical protein TWF103_010398 [Orbilia oligospora]KAF3134742.1 hypothetical protein TWF594_008667 [Orbilia oligospora]KAF3137596.1 hypothetical protein TWF703_005021 [Orbilia oligospora]